MPEHKEEDLLPNSKYGVICEYHDEQGLSYTDYMQQLGSPDTLWKCPICKQPADFDQDRYEAKSDA